MKDVLIVGNGIVGHNLAWEIAAVKPEVYDKYKTEKNTKTKNRHDVAFICVPTPYNGKDDPCNIDEVKNAINENSAELYIIKSTILPGTTEKLRELTGKHIIFSPEYYGSTHFSNNYEYDFTVLGGEREDCKTAVQILQHVYDCRHKFYITEARAAELAKYMENTFLAMKVSFCNQFWEISKQVNTDYEVVRELFLLDPRINPANTYVFEDKPYWTSHCYDKDIPAIAETYDAEFILAMIKYNENMKKKCGGRKQALTSETEQKAG